MSATENNSATDTADNDNSGSAESTEHDAAVGESNEAGPTDSASDAASSDDGAGDAATETADSNASQAPTGDADSPEAEAAGNDVASDGKPVELDIDSLSAALATERKRADENWDRVLRMQADMENQRKRSQRDVQNARKFALEGMINDLLPVRDSLEMGLAAASQTDADISSIVEGSELTLKMLSQAFEKYNIEEVNPVDQKFNPDFHQAMSMQEVEGHESNTVINVLQKGYTLNDRLIRPALVIVAK